MKYAFSTLGCPNWSWQEITDCAQRLGYDGIEVRGIQKELYLPSMPEFTGAAAATTRRELEKQGLRISLLSAHSPIGIQDNFAHTLFESRAYIDTAAALGVRYIRLKCEPGAQPRYPVDEGLMREALGELGRIAHPMGVTVLLETSGYYADTLKAARLMDTLDNPGVGILWDVNHPYRFFGEAPAETVANIGKWLRYMHLKDSTQPDADIEYHLLGEGDLPLDDVFAQLAHIGYDGWCSLDWVRRWNPEMEEADVAFAHYIQKVKSYIS